MDCSREASSLLELSNLPPELIEIIRNGPNSTFLAAVSTAALEPQLTESIFTCLEPFSVELAARWTREQRVAAAAAYGRVLPVIPHLFEVARHLFQPVDEEYDLLSQFIDASGTNELQPSSADIDILRKLLLSIYRLLRLRNDDFAHLVRPAKLQRLLQHADRSICYLAIRLMCLFVHASDAVMEDMISKYLGPGDIRGEWEGKEIDYRFLSLWEEKRVKDFKSALQVTRERQGSPGYQSPYTRIIRQDDLSPSVVEVCGVLLFRSRTAESSALNVLDLVSTSTTVSNVRQMAEALLEPGPVMVTGLPGSGKSSIVRYLASILHKSATMVTLHLNEQSDAKLLIGIYTTGAQPGSFQWQPGVLTTAVKEGRWVLIEDLDRAPNEILSTILPLIERRELTIPSRGETLRAAPGFKIIATMRSHVNLKGEEITTHTKMLGQRLWRRVTVGSPPLHEIEQIIVKRNPILSNYMPRIVAVYSRLRHPASRGIMIGHTSNARTRPISVRELFNWCARLSDSLYKAGVRTGHEAISEHAIDSMLLDAVDCFTGSLEDVPNRDSFIACIAEELHIDPQRKDHLLRDRMPSAKRTKIDGNDTLVIGRAILSPHSISKNAKLNAKLKTSVPFALNGYSLRLLEQVSVAVERKEPLLLVGETGIGKTTAVQHLAQMLGYNLLAINLSQQSESGDLLGGLKPVNTRSLIIPLKDEFDMLFDATFSQKKNRRFIELLSKSISKGQWKRVVALWKEALKMVDNTFNEATSIELGQDGDEGDQRAKRRKIHPTSTSHERARWDEFAAKIHSLEHRLTGSDEAFMFSYTEGNLVKAVREGDWVLLDEINLASPDTLECLTDLLESGPNTTPSLMLTETGNVERILAHPNFRIFAAMNPSTDVGKKDLPMGIRSRFTEIYVNSPDRDTKSLQSIVKLYLDRADSSLTNKRLIVAVTELYQEIQRLVREAGLVDGSGQRPHYSLRTLTRALAHTLATAPQCSVRRALYEGFSMCFFTALNNESESKLQALVKSKLFGDEVTAKAELRKPLRRPEDGKQYLPVTIRVESVEKGGRTREEQYWMAKGQEQTVNPEQYIVTPYIARNLRNLIRAASTGKHPILIQGPTSAGKTSMVEYLAKRSGNKFVRINNHEHTDLQEYLGSYVSTSDGRLVFQEGVLVQAVRAGHWVVLDELNLAPTDVLEALNRLLDDNRELLIPETQETVRPHPDFMLFATQNPAGPYGGRKALSRAFRNRFLELHFDDIPVQELNVILARRSNLPESWCGLIVEVYNALSQQRQEQRLFEQNSFATLRDLFRWAFRGANSVEELADNGFMLLAEKVRKPEERLIVKEIVEKTMSRKGVKINIDPDKLYNEERCTEISLYDRMVDSTIVWTKAMRRLFVLVSHAIRNNEAVLLVGETGCGKTTVCQMLAQALGQKLHIVNAHQNTETGDLIGAQRPIRGRAAVEEELVNDLSKVLLESGFSHINSDQDIDRLLVDYDVFCKEKSDTVPAGIANRITVNRTKRKALFEWNDGSLVQAMRAGQFYLLDEISLADDSVLERMNSVLDPQRSILLAEKGTQDSLVIANAGFQFFATMNPGGDFGKKELSPALRNRFTEIWVPHLSDNEDILQIVQGKLKDSATSVSNVLVSFARWFSQRYSSLKVSVVSIRDILAWVHFINSQQLDLVPAVIHGAAMVYIDTLGANPAALLPVMGDEVLQERNACLETLTQLLNYDAFKIYDFPIECMLSETLFTLGPFSLRRTPQSVSDASFNFQAPTTKVNAMRVVRALQLNKPVLLEGNPGVGKTSIITAIAKAVGKSLTRINLSEQTDLMDLFGSDVPAENEDAGHFVWRDAPFLTAMKRGDWVLLDEMNLASQSVLEGLNACLDHRGEVYVAELDQTFPRHPNFRLFAAQNPHHQGGGRKGLPASFVNRFTVVYADVFKQEDLMLICTQLFPSAETDLINKLVTFVTELDSQVTTKRSFGARGAPWEFNLRDTLRWLQLLTSQVSLLPAGNARDFYATLFSQRFRTPTDVSGVENVFTRVFEEALPRRGCYTNMTTSSIQVGLALLPRNKLVNNAVSFETVNLNTRLPILESLLLCVQQNWPVILVGSSGAGKSYLLNILASMVGTKMEVFSLNADIDATDLIGGYEQADSSRELQAFLRDVEEFLRSEIARRYSDSDETDSEMTTALLEALQELRSSDISKTLARIGGVLERFARQMASPDVALLLQRYNTLHTFQVVKSGKFEWIDGTLVKALETGYWLVLDNANLCSSAVLDRLNSLLEPEGSLIINEHCMEDGSPRLIKPHPNFRIFLTVDPQYGEVSRAMRNRAVEIFLPPWEESSSELNLASSRLSSESHSFRFEQYISICQQGAGRLDWQEVNDIASEILSFSDVHNLTSLSNQAGVGLVDGQLQTHLLTVENKYKKLFEENQDWQLASLGYYQDMQTLLDEPADFRGSQSIYPLINQPLVKYNDKFTSAHDPHWLSQLHDFSVEIARMKRATVSVQSIQQNPKAMNRLQRSFAAARIPHANKESTYKVAPFLMKVLTTLSNWRMELNGQSHGDHVSHRGNIRLGNQADVIQTTFNFTKTVQRFWWDLYDVTSTFEFQEATFQIYLQSGTSSILGLEVQDGRTQKCLQEVSELLQVFHAVSRLTTGLSMELIWNTFRSAPISTMERLNALIQLEQLADRFDDSLWQFDVPIEELNAVRQSIASAIATARHQDTDVVTLIRDLESSIDQPPNDTDVSRLVKNKPFFQDVFEGLCQYTDFKQFSPTELNWYLGLLACRATKSAYVVPDNLYPTAEVLEAIVRYSGTSTSLGYATAMTGDLPFILLEKLAISGEVSLHQRDLLQFETTILGRCLAVSTQDVCVDQVGFVLGEMRHLLSSVLFAHRDYLATNAVLEPRPYYQLEVLREGRRAIEFAESLPEEHYFRQIADKYFQPLQHLLMSGENSDEQEAWEALISFAIGCLLLYVPNRSFDPALKARVQKDLHDKHYGMLHSKLETLEYIEQTSSGNPTSLRCDVLKQEIENLGDSPDVAAIARPSVHHLDQLQVEFTNVLRLTERVVQERSRSTETMHYPHDLVITVSRVVSRLEEENFRAYEDLTKPIVGFLNILSLGMRLHSKNEGQENTSLRFSQSLLRDMPFMNLHPESWSATFNVMNTTHWKHDNELQLHLLRMFSFRTAVERISDWNSLNMNGLTDLLDRFYINWKTQLTKEQKEAAASTSLYTYRGSQEDEDEDDAGQFNELFPTFDEDSEADLDTARSSKNMSTQKLTSTIASLHVAIFSNESNSAESLEDLLRGTCQLLGQKAGKESLDFPRQSMQQFLPSLLLLMKSEVESNVEQKPNHQYNIYTDPNTFEAKRLIKLVNEIQACFKPIIQVWPEHATLHNIHAACNELLSLRHVEPVMKILVKAEKLHDYIAEWQSVASKEFSAVTVFNKLTDLLISWRQLELSTWARLLDLEMEKCQDDAKTWWFIAYENVIIVPQAIEGSLEDSIDHSSELMKVLEAFLSNSAIGQYEPKLQILRSLEAQMRFLGADNPVLQPVRNALANFIHYFERFIPPIAEAISKGRKDLAKQVQNIIQLATWKDRNINALKQSAKSSHRKLFRAVKKFRNLLAQPSAQYLRQDNALITAKNFSSRPTILGPIEQANQTALSLCRENIEFWNDRPIRFKEVDATVRMMRSKTVSSAGQTDALLCLQDFITNLDVSIEHLQKVTPSVLTEENTPSVKHLTTRKRKLFTDTLKEIRRMGVTYNLSSDVLVLQNSLSSVLSRMPNYPIKTTFEAGATAQATMESILGLMPDVRHAISEHSEDIQQSEIVRSVGYMEGFLSICLKQRRNLIDAMNKFHDLDITVSQIEALWSSDHCQAQCQPQSVGNREKEHALRTSWLPTIFRVGMKILTAQAELGKLDFQELISELGEYAKILEDLSAQLSNMPILPVGLANTSYVNLEKIYFETARSIRTQILQRSDTHPHAKLILDHLQKWICFDNDENTLSVNGHPHVVPESVLPAQYEMLDSMLGSIQDVAKAKQNFQFSEEQPSWLVVEDVAQQSILKAFHADTVGQALQQVLLQLSQLAGSGESSLQMACASLTVALPIVRQYQALYREVVAAYAELHATTCKVTYKLARSFNVISKQGFCKPAEKSNDKTDTSDKLESGTGLGEGEGAEDISKDIGADEDLSELAQDQNNKQPDHDLEKHDDAVDIDDEFEGAAGDETGDMEDEEHDGKDGQSQSGEEGEDGSIGGGEDGGEEADGENAVDEDVGSVDDVGPSAVDEKLWDQAGDEENKEKEGTQPSKNVDKDEQVAGKEETGKRSEEGQDEGQDREEDGDSADDANDGMSNFGSETGSPVQDETMDPHVKESEALELPEDIQLDGDKTKEDLDMDGNSDEEMLDDLDNMDDGEKQEEQDPAADEADGEDGMDAEEQGHPQDLPDQEETDHPETQDQQTDQGQGSNDQEMADFNDQPGGGEANDAAEEKSEQQAPTADARGEAPEEESKDQTSSASNAQHKTGVESQAAEKTQPASSDDPQDSQQQSRPQQESHDRQNLRKLGNVLEKWHRQQREIREAAEEVKDRTEDEQGDVDMADAEFEHLPDDETEADTQALGASSKEQARALDESMAVESTNREDERPFEDFAPEEEVASGDEDEDVEMKDDAITNAAGQAEGTQTTQPQTFIGERQPLDLPDQDISAPTSPSPDLPPSPDLSTLHLTTLPPSPSHDTTDPTTRWTTHTARTAPLSASLTSHLRLILSPTTAARLRGDHRTGKRLNIKRIIPYIASSYKRDRIWLRRSLPTKRSYQIMLALDDSKSMAENGSSDMAFDCLALVANALTALEAGELAVLGFGESVFVAHDFGTPFSGASGSGPEVLGRFGFAQTKTDVQALVRHSIDVFRAARARAQGGSGVADLWQLQLVLSDGICEDHEGIRRLLVTAQEERIMVVFVVVDAAAGSGSSSSTAQGQGQSILDLEKVEFVEEEEAQEGENGIGGGGGMKLIRKKYLDTFPFAYYLVVRNIQELPGVLATALRQWFAEVAER